MNISPYLFFDGRCEEAMNFYKDKLGAEVEMMMRFSDAPEGGPPGMAEEHKSKIMHASLKVCGSPVMVSDGMCQGGSKPRFDGFSLAINLSDAAKAEKIFEAIATDGEVRQPLIETFFASKFGVVSDKFGVSWMVVADR